jgi:hypothetical protein
VKAVPRVNEPVVLTLSPAVRAGAVVLALLLVGMLAVLIGVLISLESTRSEIRTTRAGVLAADHRSARLKHELDPLLDAAAPLAGDGAQRALGHAATRAGQAVDAVTSIATALDRTLPNVQALLRSQRRLNRRSVSTQRIQLAVLRRSYALLAQSLGIQREVLQHTRSLDAKPGGQLPATPPVAAPAPVPGG